MAHYLGPLPIDPAQPEALEAYIGLLCEGKDYEYIKHPAYEAQVDHALAMAVHAKKDPGMHNPKARDLIEAQRPNELPEVRDHRIANYRQITLPQWERVENTLYKIFNPRLTAVHYNNEPFKKGVSTTLEQYLKEEIDLEEWVRTRAFPETLRDPGGMVAVMPLESSLEDKREYVEPVPTFYSSDRVIDYDPGKYYLFYSRRKSDMDKDGMAGDVFFLIDSARIFVIYQVPNKDSKKAFKWDMIYRHDIGAPPVVHLPGVEEEYGDDTIVWSFCSGVLPNWDEALVSKSDYQAVKNRHAFPRHWQIKVKCPKCAGKGQNTSASLQGGLKVCDNCEGTGLWQAAKGPTDSTLIDAKAVQDAGFPIPPEGYVEPDGSTLEFLRKDVDIEIAKGFEAINMDEGRKDTNVEESGEYLKQNRDRLGTFMDRVAGGIYKLWENTAYYIAAMRYRTMMDPAKIAPVIERPKTYDLKSPMEHAATIKAAKEANLSYSIIAKEELDYIRKEYGEDSALYLRTKCAHDIDPLPGMSPEDAIQMEGHARKVDLWVHFNLDRMIDRAMDEHGNFHQLPRPKKVEIVYGYAQEELDALKPVMIPAPE